MTGERHHGSHLAVTEPVSAPERLRWLRRTARRWILVLVLLVVACLLGAGWSLGLFTDSSTSADNVVTAGSMTQDNSADNTAIMGATGMVPGDTVRGSATIENVGGARGDFTLLVTDVSDVAGPNGGLLSERLVLKVFQDKATRAIYSGPITGLDLSLGTWQPEEQHVYRFEVTLPTGGDTVDDKQQQSSLTATFEWNAVQAH